MLRSGQPLTTQWRDINRQAGQTPGVGQHFHKGEIIADRDAIETKRSRQLFGGAAGMSLSSPLMEYDMTQPYGAQIWVHVGAANNAATTGTIDPNSGLTVKSTPGWYCSGLRPVPLTTFDGSPAYYIPQVPLPDASDIDSDLNYWVIFIADSQCY